MNGIDVHVHHVPPDWLERARTGEWADVVEVNGELVSGGATLRLTPGLSDLGAAPAVRSRLLSIPPPLMAYDAPANVAVPYCAAFNDLLAACAHERGERALATLPLQDPDAAADELRRAHGIGCAGAQIGAHVGGRPLDEMSLRPVFRAAAELRVVLLVHPQGSTALGLGAELEPALDWPLQTTTAGVALMRVLGELPSLKIVLAHGGGALPFLLGRLDRAYDVREDVREVLPERPSAVARTFYYDSVLFTSAALRFLVATVGASRVLLGTDYPFGIGLTDPIAALTEAGVDDASREQILEANASALLADVA